MNALERAVAAISLGIARLAIPLMILLGAGLVFGRHLRIGPDADLKEAIGLLFFLVVMGSFGYAYLRDAHVRVLVADPHSNPALVRQIAAGSGARSLTLQTSVSGGDYLSLFDANVRRLAAALEPP